MRWIEIAFMAVEGGKLHRLPGSSILKPRGSTPAKRLCFECCSLEGVAGSRFMLLTASAIMKLCERINAD